MKQYPKAENRWNMHALWFSLGEAVFAGVFYFLIYKFDRSFKRHK